MDYTHTPDQLTPRVLERQGCPLHYWTAGPEVQGTAPLVFLHGVTMDHRMFNTQAEAFLPGRRVLVLDLRGHGLSQPLGSGFDLEVCAQDVLAVLNQERIDQAVLIGLSMGGYIAQYVYHQAPRRVKALVMIGSSPIFKPYSKTDVWMLKATLPLFNLWPFKSFMRTVARSVTLQPQVQQYALQAMAQIGREDFLVIWKAVTLMIDDKGLPGYKIEVPLLLMHGEKDQAGTILKEMPRWAEADPQAVYRVIPRAGHHANQDNPGETNRVLREFMEQKNV